MKTLFIRYTELDDLEMLRAYLNGRGKEPTSKTLYQVPVEYPEPGVLRKYFSGGKITAWVDEVIDPNKFRVKEGLL